MKTALALLLLALLILPLSAQANGGCGEGGRCVVSEGYYLAEPPPDWDGESALPLVVFFHGWNSSPEGMFRNRALVEGITRRGALFVAPWAQTGYWRQIGDGRAEGGRDELAYVRRVLADLERRWPLDRRPSCGSGRAASVAPGRPAPGGRRPTHRGRPRPGRHRSGASSRSAPRARRRARRAG